MKHIHAFSIGLCFALLLGAQAAFGQVTMNFVMNPNPSPFLSDWSSRKETARIDVWNNDPYAETVVRFQAVLSLNGQIVAQTKRSAMPFVRLPQGQQTFNAEDVFPYHAIEFLGGIDASAQRLGRLSEGVYSICVQVTNAETGNVIVEQDCKSFIVRDVRPPQLVSPGYLAGDWQSRADELQDRYLLDLSVPGAQLVPFSWVAPQPSQPDVRYRFNIYPVRPAEYPYEVIKKIEPIYQREVRVPQILVPLSEVFSSLEGDILHHEIFHGLTWNVQALDAQGNAVGANNGTSEPFYVPLGAKNSIRSFFDVWVDVSDLAIDHEHGVGIPRYSTVAEFRASIAKIQGMATGIKAYLDTLKNGLPNMRGRTEPLTAVTRRILEKIDRGDLAGAVYDVFHFDSKTFSLISYIMKAGMAGDIPSPRVTDMVSVIEVPPIPVEGFEPPRVPVAKVDTLKVDTAKCICKPKVKIRVTWNYIAPCGNYSRTTNGYAANNTLNGMSRNTLYKFTPEVQNCPHAGHWTSEVTAPTGASYGFSTSADGSVTLLSESGGTYTVTFTWHCPCGPKPSETFTINFK